MGRLVDTFNDATTFPFLTGASIDLPRHGAEPVKLCKRGDTALAFRLLDTHTSLMEALEES